ncbi:hypothetical protein LTR53_007671 [Teratosphaeriaceae sp. CCFEE 6253]|nr:hypothetical protein LTR53_007671 [Teratosphaeriaceae sp. CCFEE 6253]
MCECGHPKTAAIRAERGLGIQSVTIGTHACASSTYPWDYHPHLEGTTYAVVFELSKKYLVPTTMATMLDKNDHPRFSAECNIRFPSRHDTAEEVISRWSNTKVALRAAIVVPATEDDLVTAIEYAQTNALKVILVGGAHGTFVPIDSKCLYLQMSRFNSIDLDEQASTVTFGGGVITREVIRTLGERGYYTCVPSSSAVGMAGFCLGGGSSPYNGLVGMAIDNILLIRIITADGKEKELSPSSSGEDADLFNVLCGAGFGFGVVVSITLRAWRISDLNLDEDRMWTRKLIFPPSAITAAATLFTELRHPEPRLTATLVFVRAPPNAPRPGAPMILLSLGYLGSAADGVIAAAASFDEHYTSQAIVAESGSAAPSTMNDVSAPFDRHGDFKEQYSAWCSSLSEETIVSTFNRWVRFGEETPDAKMTSFLVIAAKGTQGLLEHDIEGHKFFPRTLRARSVFVQAVPWWTDAKDEEQARGWAAETLALVNAPQHNGHVEDIVPVDAENVTGYAANLRKAVDLSTVWPADQLERIRQLKDVWDPQGLFWNPVVHGV